MKQNFTVRRGALERVEAFVSVTWHRSFRRAAAELGVTPSAISQAARACNCRLTDSSWRASRTRSKVARPAGLGQWPCSIRSLPNWLSLRSDRRMKRDQEKRVVVLMLATLLPIEGPLRVMSCRVDHIAGASGIPLTAEVPESRQRC